MYRIVPVLVPRFWGDAICAGNIPQMLPPKYRKCHRQKIKKHLVEYSRMPKLRHQRNMGLWITFKERLMTNCRITWMQVPLREPDLLMVITGGEYAYTRPDGSRSSRWDA